MALQRRAVATNTDGGTASLTAVVNKPTGTTSGDLILVGIGCADDAAGLTISPPDGTWTQQTDIHYTATGAMHLTTATKVAGGSEPSTYSFTISGTTGGANVGWVTIAVGYYSDASGSAAIDQKATSGVASGATHTTSSITPSVNNCKVVSFFAQDQSAGGPPTWSPSSPVGLTELADVSETTTNFGMCSDEESQTTATATSHSVTESGGDTTRGSATAILSVREITLHTLGLMGVGT